MKLSLLTALVFALLVAGCAAPPADEVAPTPTGSPVADLPATPLPTVFYPTFTNAPSLPSNCQEWATLNQSEYQVINNTWGRGDLADWSQCIDLVGNDNGTVGAHWTWGWPEGEANVKAYPEIIFGRKPGSPPTSPALPAKVSAIKSVIVNYQVTSTHTGSGSLVFDLWLTDTDDPSTWGTPPITHGIMVRLESFGTNTLAGKSFEEVNIAGMPYEVYVGVDQSGYGSITFTMPTPQLEGSLDLASFLAHLLEKGLINGDEYLASIELGNEIISGSGETTISLYSVIVTMK